MPTAIVVPELGAGEQTVRVSGWLVEPGEQVILGDRLAELLVKGVTFDVSATTSGVLRSIERPVSCEVHAGETLGWLEESENSGTDGGEDCTEQDS